MPTFSFTEKEWDKVRPASVKKTGVSEAMREVLKKVPKDLKSLADGKACDDAVKLLDELDTALSGAEGLVKKAKDDKHDAAGKLKAWRAEVKDGKELVAYPVAAQAAVVEFTRILSEVEDAIADAKRRSDQVLKDLSAGRQVDLDELTKTQQNFRGTQRSARDAVSKSGSIHLLKSLPEVHGAKLDAAKVEPPTEVIKKIGAKIDALETETDALGEAIGQAIEKQSHIDATGAVADEARALLDEYKESHKKLKAMTADGKRLLATAKRTNQTIRSSPVTDTSKFMAVIHKLHQTVQDYEEQLLKESYRSRDSSGELQQKLSAMTKKEEFVPLNKAFRDWRAAIFDVVRLCTLPIGGAKFEIDDVVEFVISLGGATAGQAETQKQRIAEERQALRLKYGATG